MTSKSKSNERDEYYGPLISMLRETIAQLQKASEAGHQGEEASIQTLRRRCFEAEERVRRADREVAELRYEADELHKRLASKMQGHRGDVTLLKDDSDNVKALDKIAKEAVAESRSSAAALASRADAETAAQRGTTGVHREAYRELCDGSDDADVGKTLKTWTAGAWLEGLGVGPAIADVLLNRLRKRDANSTVPAIERGFLRMLGEHGSPQLVKALLKEHDVFNLITNIVWRGIERLLDESRMAQDSHQLVHKFHADGATALGFAKDVKALHGGLDYVMHSAGIHIDSSLLMAPSAAAKIEDQGEGPLIQAMREEHCESVDSRERFTSPDYGIATTSETEYWFVVAPQTGLRHLNLAAWPAEGSAIGASKRRVPTPLRDYSSKVKEVNGRLAELHNCPPLRREELIALRLLTSPMRVKYNAVLRAIASETAAMRNEHANLCGGGSSSGELEPPNYYPITINLINSALVKLMKLTKPETLYRSMHSGVLPQSLWRPNMRGVHAVVEAGFLACMRDPKAMLLHAARQNGGLMCTVLAVREADGACGADLSWVSQYPEEGEFVFPPLTSLRLLRSHVDGSALVVEVEPVTPSADCSPFLAVERCPLPVAQSRSMVELARSAKSSRESGGRPTGGAKKVAGPEMGD